MVYFAKQNKTSVMLYDEHRGTPSPMLINKKEALGEGASAPSENFNNCIIYHLL